VPIHERFSAAHKAARRTPQALLRLRAGAPQNTMLRAIVGVIVALVLRPISMMRAPKPHGGV